MTLDFVLENFKLGGNGNSPFTFYKRGFILGGGKVEPTWRDIIISGNTALTLVNAKADGLNYVKLFGECEQPAVDIISTCTCNGTCVRTGSISMTNPSTLTINNGVLGSNSSGSLTVTGTNEILTDEFGNTATVQNLFAFPNGTYYDTHNILTGTITRRINVLVLTGDENWAAATVGSTKRYRVPLAVNPKLDGSSSRGSIASTHFTTIHSSGAQTVGGAFTYSGNFLYIIPDQSLTTVEAFEEWLADQITAGTPVIVMYPRSSNVTQSVAAQTNLVRPPVTATGSISNLTVNITTTESTTPSPTNPMPIICNNGELKADNQGNVYADGTVETVKDSLDNTATAENLFSVGTYADVQDVLSGNITRRCEAFVYDGTQTVNTPYLSTQGLNVGSIIVHPLATPITETVTPQTLTTQQGTNVIEITQASIDNLALEVSYKGGVSVTVEEVENANLDDSVTVTIEGE